METQNLKVTASLVKNKVGNQDFIERADHVESFRPTPLARLSRNGCPNRLSKEVDHD